jgi:hypothetical protein
MSIILTQKDIELIKKNINKKFPEQIKTKLKNINKARAGGHLGTKRVSQNSRILLMYETICKNNLSLGQLNSYKPAITVGLKFQDYLYIIESEERTELDNYLIENIGSDNTVSAIIMLINDKGSSGGSGQLQELYKKLLQKAEENSWELVTKKTNITNINKGNDKWYGHYYYNISGGSTTFKENSHPGNNTETQIFTDSRGFISNDIVIKDIEYSLYYQLLYTNGIEKYITTNLSEYREKFKLYLKNTYYNGETLYEALHKIITIHNDILLSPIECIALNIDDFEGTKIQISHNESTDKEIIYYDEEKNILLSDYRPGNLFWDTKIGNMQQQNFTIQEFWTIFNERQKRRNEILSLV